MNVTIDKSKWDARYRRILSRRAYARREATIVSGKAIVRLAFDTAPEDTLRFKKNLAQASNRAGVGPLPVPPTRQSKYHELYLKRLMARLEDAIRWDEKYQREDRIDQPYYRKILRRRARAELELRRFQQTQDAIVIGAGNIHRGGFWGENKATVRYKNYTGRGRIRQTRDQTVIEIHNTEAHASIVEARHKTMRNAINAVRASGGQVMRLTKKKYLQVIGEGGNG